MVYFVVFCLIFQSSGLERESWLVFIVFFVLLYFCNFVKKQLAGLQSEIVSFPDHRNLLF